jgi:PAS domain S-box-containing protein
MTAPGIRGPRSPWWTWPVAFAVLQAAAWLSVPTSAPGGWVWYWPTAIGIALAHGWGIQVLIPLYASAVLHGVVTGLPWELAPLYALPECTVVLLSWLLFTRVAGGKAELPDLPHTLKFGMAALAAPLAVGRAQMQLQLVLFGGLDPAAFWSTFTTGWLADVLAAIAITVPILVWAARPAPGPRSSSRGPVPLHRVLARIELWITFGATLSLALAVPAERYWVLYGLFVGWTALRRGLLHAALANSWTIGLTVAVPVVISGLDLAALLSARVEGIGPGLLLVCTLGLLLGRAVSDRQEELRRRSEAEASLRDNEVRLRAMIQKMPLLVCACDADWNVVAWNPVCERITGYSAQEMIGDPQGLRRLIQDEEERTRMIAEWAGAGETYGDHEWSLTCADGSQRIVVWSGLSEHFTVEGWSAWGVGFDVTESREAGHQLQDYTERLRQTNELLEARRLEVEATNQALQGASRDATAANRAKSQFLANMSHEIRTPMTAILGFTELLFEEGDLSRAPSNRLDALRTIKRNGEYLIGLLNDILDLSKIEAGRLEIEQVKFSPMELVSEVRSLMKVRARAAGLALESDYRTEIPETIQCDPTRLRQILINLVGNALKFTEEGKVQLVLELAGAPKAPMLRFDVIDTGIGMDADQIPRIFEPFSQADGSTTRRFGGTGLGLSICKRLAELMGGWIEVESERGSGSMFRLCVPTGKLDGVRMIEDPEDEDLTLPPEKFHAEFGRKSTRLEDRRVLLVEDGPDNQRLISHVLRRVGAEVTIAEDGQIAVDLVRTAEEVGRSYDVILMDMQMPVLDGYSATRILREDGYTRPIIALTAHAMAGDRERCFQAGCDDFATKPIDRERFLETVVRYATAEQKKPESE